MIEEKTVKKFYALGVEFSSKEEAAAFLQRANKREVTRESLNAALTEAFKFLSSDNPPDTCGMSEKAYFEEVYLPHIIDVLLCEGLTYA